jgi:hypothetical protein
MYIRITYKIKLDKTPRRATIKAKVLTQAYKIHKHFSKYINK